MIILYIISFVIFAYIFVAGIAYYIVEFGWNTDNVIDLYALKNLFLKNKNKLSFWIFIICTFPSFIVSLILLGIVYLLSEIAILFDFK